MSDLIFENIQDIVIFDNGDNPLGASFKPIRNGELRYIKAHFYTQGQPTGQVRLNILSADDQATPIASSNYVNLTTITSSTNYVSIAPFTFNRISVSANTTYYIQFETTGYTRNGDTDFLSFRLQQVGTPNTNLNSVTWANISKPAEFELYIGA